MDKVSRPLPISVPDLACERDEESISDLSRTLVMKPSVGSLTSQGRGLAIVENRGRILFGNGRRPLPNPISREIHERPPQYGAAKPEANQSFVAAATTGENADLDSDLPQCPGLEPPDDLGATRAMSVDDLFARQRVLARASAATSVASVQEKPTRVELLRRGVKSAISGAQHTWQNLSRTAQRGLAVLLLGALFWGINAAYGAPSAPPATPFAVPMPAARALPANTAAVTRLDAGSSSAPSASLPVINSRFTLERAAVDAVAEGRYPAAIQFYDALARAHPDRPVYREAARVLAAQTTQRP